ncbi:MAG: (d)CMP kinase [Pseudomonadota bacterium]
MKFTVAIDGPAGAGKGTIAKHIASEFGFEHLDTGLLYRAVGKVAMDQGRGVIDEGLAELIARDLNPDLLRLDGLRTTIAARAASRVATIPGVRKALLDFQKRFAKREGGAVLDGRDIGTVIAPQADVKLYVTATAEERARRRHAELTAAGGEPSIGRILAELRTRDEQDTTRKDAPLRRAPDALLLDTTDLSIDAAAARAAEIVQDKLNRFAD